MEQSWLNWHITDLSTEKKEFLRAMLEMVFYEHMRRLCYAESPLTIKDILIIGSRAYPPEYKHLVRDDSDLDVLIIAEPKDFRPYPRPSELSFLTFWDGLRITIKITDRYPTALPYYSLTKDTFVIPTDLSKFKEILKKKMERFKNG